MNTPIVKNNLVQLLPGADAGIFLWDVSNASVSDNKITGDGRYGVALGYWDWPLRLGNNGNTVMDTNLKSFNPSIAFYYLGNGVTNNMFYVDKEDVVLDESGNDTNMIYH